MRYGFEVNDNGLIVYISPTIDDGEYYISDIDNLQKQHEIEIIINKVDATFVIDGSAENSIFLTDIDETFVEKFIIIMASEGHTLVSNISSHKKLAKSSKKPKKPTINIADITTPDQALEILTNSTTQKIAKEIIVLDVAKGRIDFLQIILKNVFMKYSTEEQFFKKLEWFISPNLDLTDLVLKTIENRKSAEDGSADNDGLSSISGAWLKFSKNKTALKNIITHLDKTDAWQEMIYTNTIENIENQDKANKLFLID